MAKSQQTFSKSEKEKKRLKKRLDKQKKMDARKAEKEENGSTGIQFAYVDHNGNLTDTPPDPSMKIKVKAKNIVIGIPTKEESDAVFDPVRNGKVSFYDSSKGFGFIEMPKPGEAKAAIKNLNNKTVGSNQIRVKKAESGNT